MKLTDARQLDWSRARRASEAITRFCEDAAYVAPEALQAHADQIQRVCSQMNEIVAALLITPPTGDAR